MSYLVPVELANQAVDACNKVIAGLLEDNKRLHEKVKSLEELAEENREEYEKLYKAHKELLSKTK